MPKEMAEFQVRTEADRLHRLDALRIVMGSSRARVVNALIDKALKLLEKEHSAELDRLHALGAGRPGGWVSIVKAYADRNQRKTYGETLEELEQMYMASRP